MENSDEKALIPGDQESKKADYSATDNDSDPKMMTSTEVITRIGFGWGQAMQCAVLWLGFFAEAAEIFIMPILSTRLYVEWQLSPSLEAALGACSYAGFALSYPIWGFISDWIGRKKSLILANTWITIWGGACALAPSLYWLLAFRLLFSLAGGIVNIMFPFYYEFLPPKQRWLGFVTGTVGFTFGGMYPIILAYFMLDNERGDTWRYYVAFTVIPCAVFVILMILIVDESPRFLVSANRVQDAKRILGKLAKRNNYKLSEDYELKMEEERASSKSFSESVKAILNDRHIAKSLICILFFGISTRYIIYGLAFVKTELLFLAGETADYCSGSHEKSYLLTKEDYLKLMVLQSFDLFGNAIGAYFLLFEVSLRASGLLCYSVGTAAMLLLYSCPHVWTALCLVVLCRSFTYGFISNMWFSLSGLLPTEVRTSLFGVCTFIMYSVLPGTPYVIQVLSKHSQHLVTSSSLLFTLMGLVAALIVPTHIYSN